MASIEDTLKELEQYLKTNPNDASAWNSRGVLLARTKQFGEALRSVDQAIRLNPNHAEAHTNRARILLAIGPEKAGEALKSFDRALELVPKNTTILRDKALALRLLGRSEEELECLETISRHAPEEASLWIRAGDIELELGRFEEAVKRYDKALSIDSKLAATLVHRAIALAMLEKWKEADESAESATKLAPDEIEAWRVLADVNMRAGKYKSAMKALKRASEIDPTDASVENSMGMVAYKEGRLHDAAKHFEKAIVRKRNHTSALKNLGFVYMELEQWEDASRTWSALTSIVKDDPNIYDAQATNYARLNDFCSAAEAWEHARKLYKRADDEKEAARVHELGRAARINCGRQKEAVRAAKEREKAERRQFRDGLEIRRRKQQEGR